MFKKPNGVDVSVHKAYSEDGLELDALLFEPKNKTKRIVIHIHGKEGHFIQNHFVTSMGYAYPLDGYSFITFNNRGHDYMADMLKKSSTGLEWVTRGSAYEIIEESVQDINGIIQYILQLGYEEIILQGHSLGPHKISYYLANKPKYDISKAILLTTADIRYLLDSTLSNWQHISLDARKMIDQNKGNELMEDKLWSNSPMSAKTFWHYTNPHSNTWIFNFTHPDDEFKHFDKIEIPILVVVPEQDFSTGVIQSDAMKMLKARTKSIDFSSVIIPNTVHNFASKEDELVRQIINWLTSRK